MNNSTGRSSLIAIAGAYILYLAYGLLKNMLDNVPTTMPPVVQILAIALFTGAGIALMIYAWKIWTIRIIKIICLHQQLQFH